LTSQLIYSNQRAPHFDGLYVNDDTKSIEILFHMKYHNFLNEMSWLVN